MDAAEAVIASKLETVRKELAEKEAAEQAYQDAEAAEWAEEEDEEREYQEAEERARQAAEEKRRQVESQTGHPGELSRAERERARRAAEREFRRLAPAQVRQESRDIFFPDEEQLQRQSEIHTLGIQEALLNELKGEIEKQRAETRTAFLTIEARDTRASRENVRLTVISSAVSLLVGWSLSFLGSPATLLHLFGH